MQSQNGLKTLLPTWALLSPQKGAREEHPVILLRDQTVRAKRQTHLLSGQSTALRQGNPSWGPGARFLLRLGGYPKVPVTAGVHRTSSRHAASGPQPTRRKRLARPRSSLGSGTPCAFFPGQASAEGHPFLPLRFARTQAGLGLRVGTRGGAGDLAGAEPSRLRHMLL